MLDRLQAAITRILGPRDGDPLGEITADQLSIVLKSIEEKYNQLQDDNARLQQQVEAQQREIARLNRALEEKTRV